MKQKFILPSKWKVHAIEHLNWEFKHSHVKWKYTINKNIKKDKNIQMWDIKNI